MKTKSHPLNKKIVHTVRVELCPRLYDEQITQIIQAINISVTGKKNCNKRNKSGEFVAANPPDIDARLSDAHALVRRSCYFLMDIDFTEDGEQVNHRVVKTS